MSKKFWQKLGSLELKPSDITLRAYDGFPSAPVGLYQNVIVCLAGKMVLIDIEVLDAQLDYSILLGRIYMYTMSAVSSSVFRNMMFPHEDQIVMVN